VYAKCFEKRCRDISEPKLDDNKFGVHPGRSTTDQIFTFQKSFEKSWEYAKDIYTYFVDLEKAYDRVPREEIWEMLREYGFDNRLLLAVKSLHSCSEIHVHFGGVKSQPFTMGVGLRQVYVLSQLFFIVCMHWSDSHIQAHGGVSVGSCRISRLLFTDDLVSSEQGLRRTLDRLLLLATKPE